MFNIGELIEECSNCGECVACYIHNELLKRRGKCINDPTRDIFGNYIKNTDISDERATVKLVFTNLNGNDEEITLNSEIIPEAYTGIKLKEVIYKTKDDQNRVIYRRVFVNCDIDCPPTSSSSYTKNVVFYPKRIGKTIIGWIGEVIEVIEPSVIPKKITQDDNLFRNFQQSSYDTWVYVTPPAKTNGLRIVSYYEESIFGYSLTYKYVSLGIIPNFEEYFALLLATRSKKINICCFKFITGFFQTYFENPVLRYELVDRLVFN